MSDPARIRVALVEDDPATSARLVAALTTSPGLELVHSADNARGMLQWLGEGRPDVLLVDLGLPDQSGIEVIRECRRLSPATEVMVVTLFGDEAHMIRAFEAGARGYLLKDGTEEELARHVLDLWTGGSPMSPLIARQLVARIGQARSTQVPAGPLAETLSARETEILGLIARGYTYQEAGQMLGITLNTVQSHVKSIYSKLDVHSKNEAVFEARQLGLLDR